jgi:serralysin
MPNNFSVILAGSQEVPPNASTASGTGSVVRDTATDTATYAFTFRGLDLGPALGLPPQTAATADDVTAMHFHNGARGANAPVVFGQIGPAQDADDLGIVQHADGSWTVLGAWETTDPANASIAAFAAALDSTAVGSDAPLYWNVHTTTFPAGEIRGQLVAAEDIGTGMDGTTDIGTPILMGTDNLLY